MCYVIDQKYGLTAAEQDERELRVFSEIISLFKLVANKQWSGYLFGLNLQIHGLHDNAFRLFAEYFLPIQQHVMPSVLATLVGSPVLVPAIA